MNFNKESKIAIIGSGTMGIGIAQVAATYGHKTYLYDNNVNALNRAKSSLGNVLDKLLDKGKISEEKRNDIFGNITFTDSLNDLADSNLVIEAIIENLEIKKELFRNLQNIISSDVVYATNTSSLSIASLSSAFEKQENFLGIHFFNPAPVLPLVEIVPSFITNPIVTSNVKNLIEKWGKIPVLAKDTPGFIVNRVARPFYSESLRILDEGIADIATIDWALKEIGGFKMGPFELMDFIGHDVNYIVTETVFKEFYYDPRFKPSLTQKRLMEAGMNGRKSGRGFYDYKEGAIQPDALQDKRLGEYIFLRVIVMLINEAFDALFMNVATKEDIELAMTKGVNYPKGLFQWGEEIGLEVVLKRINELNAEYQEDRYRPNPLLKRLAIK
jgi:3-hydroxybutyryl-CoA dehydrogenase